MRTALEAIELLGPAATTEEIFRASRRFSAAAGFLARELYHADETARFASGLPNRPSGEVRLVQAEAEKAEVEAQTPPAPSETAPEQQPPPADAVS